MIPSNPPDARGPSRRAVEYAVALILLALAGLVLWDSYGRGAGWAADGPQSGYFPARVGLILFAAALAALVSARAAPATPLVSWAQLRLAAKVLVPLCIYAAAIEFLGVYVASALFLAGFMALMDRFAPWKTALIALALPALIFWTFEIQFRQPLPKGPLETWLGY